MQIEKGIRRENVKQFGKTSREMASFFSLALSTLLQSCCETGVPQSILHNCYDKLIPWHFLWIYEFNQYSQTKQKQTLMLFILLKIRVSFVWLHLPWVVLCKWDAPSSCSVCRAGLCSD